MAAPGGQPATGFKVRRAWAVRPPTENPLDRRRRSA